MKKAIILSGPPGAGKGTQANFISEKLGVKHFDVGRHFRRMIEEGDPLMTPKLIEENKKGILLDPKVFLSFIEKNIKKWADEGKSIVFSGQPRTELEAFGSNDLEGFMDFLVKLYGKENILIFKINIPEYITIERNSKRLVCMECKKVSIASEAEECSSCGSKLHRRKDDNPKAIMKRLEEYNNRTVPIFKGLMERGFNIIEINGEPEPLEVFESIQGEIRRHE